MAGIGDSVLRILGVTDPRTALISSMLQQPQAAGAGTPTTPPDASPTPPAAGTGTGTAAPAPQPPQPAYQSPPDLTKMYEDLVKYDRRSQAISNGLGLLAMAGAQPQNKSAIASMMMGGGGGSGSGSNDPLSTVGTLLKLRTTQAELARKAADLAALPGIAKKYNMDLPTARYLYDTGKLDAVISGRETPSYDTIKAPDGSVITVDRAHPDNQHKMAPGDPAFNIEVRQAADGSWFRFNKATGENLGAVSKPDDSKYHEIVAAADGSKVLVDKRDGKNLGVVSPPDPAFNVEIHQAADGSLIRTDKSTGKVLNTIAPGDAAKNHVVVQTDSGQTVLVDKNTGKTIGVIAPPDVHRGDTTDMKELDRANTERQKAGQAPLSMEQWLAERDKNRRTQINLGPDGTDYGTPPKDMAWVRDASGKVKVDERGVPMAAPIKGTDLFNKGLDAASKQDLQDSTKALAGNIVLDTLDKARGRIATWNGRIPLTGMGSLISAIPGTAQHNLSEELKTIKANIGFDKLQEMRNASKTGGALGQVSDFENKLLQSVYGSLEQSQTKGELLYNMDRLYRIYKQIILHGIDDPAHPGRYSHAANVVHGPASAGTPTPAGTPPGPSLDDLLKKYGGK